MDPTTKTTLAAAGAAAAATGAAAGAQEEVVTWGDPSKMRILGKRFPRVEGPDKVTGRAKYTYDVVLPGMLYGRIVRSPYPSGRINSPADVDTSDAERMPGVKAIFKFVDAGGMNVRYHGQEIAAVAATTPEIATDAVRAIEKKIKFQALPFVVDTDKAKDPAAPKVRSDGPNVAPMGGGRPTVQGDVDAAFKEAAAIIEGTYEAQTRLHCCLESHGHVCKFDGDQLTVWASTQAVTGMKQAFGQGINARIICEHMGGGFGSKFGAGPEGRACMELARMAKAPVKLMLTREDEQIVNYRGPGLRAQIKLAAAADGTFLASEVRASGLGGVAMNVGTPMSQGFYIIGPKAIRVWSDTILTNAAGTAALRAPGHPQASWCWDCALDDLAAKLNMDPLEFRKRNHNDPVRRAEWEKAAKIIGWERRNKVPGQGTGVIRRGMGMGSATWGGGGGPGSVVDVTVGRDGSVAAHCGTQDIGAGTRTYLAAIMAEELGLDIKDVSGRLGDSNHPPGAASGGSVTAPSVAPATKIAAVKTRKALLEVAAKHPTFNLPPEEADEKLEFVYPGPIRLKGDPNKNITFKQLCAMLPADGLKARGDLNRQTHGALAQAGVAGCCFAEVEVDMETGKVRPLHIVNIQDCGFVVNRLQAETQVVGSITQGIAQALLEYREMDNLTGRMLNPNLEEYKLTHTREFPKIYVEIFDNPTGKVSGIGEPPVIPVAAIGNAVFNAIGVRIYDAPITPDKVLRALAQRRGAVS